MSEDVEEYYDRFYEHYHIDPYYVSVGFTDSDILIDNHACSTVAVCKLYSTGYREMVIEQSYWDNAGDYGKEELIFHELGHCVFNLGHDESLRDNNCAASIMNPYLFGDTQCYSLYRDELILDLGGSL